MRARDLRGCEPVVFVWLNGCLQVDKAALFDVGRAQLHKLALRQLDALDNSKSEALASQVPLQTPSEIVPCSILVPFNYRTVMVLNITSA